MKSKNLFPALVLLVGLAGTSALADEIAKPSPAPTVSSESDNASVDEPAVIDHVVYLAKLPSADELVKAAELKGTPVTRIDQTGDQMVVVYQYAGGRTVTFAYTLLSKAGSVRAPVTQTSTGTYQIVTPTPAPPVTTTVVYAEPSEVYYAPRVRYYDPAWDFWTPFAVGVGLGWIGGHNSGWHGGGGWHGHGGWHR